MFYSLPNHAKNSPKFVRLDFTNEAYSFIVYSFAAEQSADRAAKYISLTLYIEWEYMQQALQGIMFRKTTIEQLPTAK